MGNEATENLLDMKVVQKVIEHILDAEKEFKKAEKRFKLKKCHGVQINEYRHRDYYVSGAKVFY